MQISQILPGTTTLFVVSNDLYSPLVLSHSLSHPLSTRNVLSYYHVEKSKSHVKSHVKRLFYLHALHFSPTLATLVHVPKSSVLIRTVSCSSNPVLLVCPFPLLSSLPSPRLFTVPCVRLSLRRARCVLLRGEAIRVCGRRAASRRGTAAQLPPSLRSCALGAVRTERKFHTREEV